MFTSVEHYHSGIPGCSASLVFKKINAGDAATGKNDIGVSVMKKINNCVINSFILFIKH